MDAIVNAANGRLEGGGGVDGAIHRAAGPELKQACIMWKKENGVPILPSGKAMFTSGFQLPAKYVIHTVGPIWSGGENNEAIILASCYFEVLCLAELLGIASIAFPNISTGVYGFPKSEAALIAVKTVKSFETSSLQEITFVCFDRDNMELYQQLLASAHP